MRRGLAITAGLALVAALPMLMVAAARAETATVTIDLEGLAEGSLVSAVSIGSGASGPAIPGSIRVQGMRLALPGVNRAMVFDGACLPKGIASGCTGGDSDLFFPSLGNLLIVSEKGDPRNPGDARDGVLTFDFRGFGPGAVRVESFVLADTDTRRPSLTLFSATGTSSSRLLEATGDRAFRRVSIASSQITKMTLDLRGEGAVDEIILTVELPAPTTTTTTTLPAPTTTTTTTLPAPTTTTTTTLPAPTTTTTTLPGPIPPGNLAVSVLANGRSAGAAPGPSVETGTAVSWAYDVTNTGAGNLWALYLWHDGVGRADCPDRSLAPGKTVRCTAASTAVEGPYAQTVHAWAWDDAGSEDSARARAHYTGSASAFVPAPAIDLETFVAGEDADGAPGPVLVPGSTAEFRYVVRNTGNVELWGLWVRDGAFGTITCPTRYLRPGDTVTCVVARTAAVGRIASSAEAWGWDAFGGAASDGDPHHYVGALPVPSVEIEALVDGYDGDTPPGPRVVRQPMETIPFTYVVTNTGGVPLAAVRVTDDVLGAVACPGTTLAIGETMTCYASTAARLGEFASAGRVTAQSGTETVSDSDPIHYHVRHEPRIHHLALEVMVNGRDADDPATGPSLPVGQSARFTYAVTYTGNNIVYNVIIQDPFVPWSQLSCGDNRTLVNGQTLVCTATVPVVAGPYASLVSVVSWDPDGTRVTAQDWVHYYGMA